uniref:Uncharacterized protein n=1 Tax=Aegilops tauschii TaxID=37682 RepID=N1QVW8_AEGTA
MEAADAMPKQPLSVRTKTNGAMADDREVVGEPVSPSARLLEDMYIVIIIGFAAPMNLPAFRAGVASRIACHLPFRSIQATDKKGILRWVETTSPWRSTRTRRVSDADQAVEDYVASLSTQSMDNSRPLWDFHLLDFPTSEATSTAVMRVHHSLSDGVSLLTLLMSCARSAADHMKPPAMPPLPKRTGAIYARPRPPASAGALAFARWVWSFVLLAWHTTVDVAVFFATILFLKDTRTPFTTTGHHGELHRKRIVHRSLNLEDVKSVKQTMNCAVNDVLVGVTSAALSRYYYRKSGDNETGKDIRVRSILLVNLRPSTSVHASVNMIESGKGSDVKWGNQVGFIFLPLHIAMHSDPLDYVRKAKNTCDRKKSSLEVAFTHVAAEVFFKLFGPKAGAAIFDRMVYHTTTSLSNMIGPVEQVELFGHPVVFVASTTFVPQEAIVVNYQSYVNSVRLALAVDEAPFPDCHELLDDFSETLNIIKGAAVSLGKHNQKE